MNLHVSKLSVSPRGITQYDVREVGPDEKQLPREEGKRHVWTVRLRRSRGDLEWTCSCGVRHDHNCEHILAAKQRYSEDRARERRAGPEDSIQPYEKFAPVGVE
jgi:hypothetical protein